METRALSLLIDDSREQTERVMAQLAREAEGYESDLELEPWHDLQYWVAQGETRVVFPMASRLSEAIPGVHTRLRRDFGQVLNLISAHALLHRANRDRDDYGRIVANLADYQVVRDLIADVVTDAAGKQVRTSVRETVETVGRLLAERRSSEVSVTALGEALELDRTAAGRRVQTAIKRGYLVNDEDRSGKPARIRLGDPLPDGGSLLPEGETLLQEPAVPGNSCTPAQVALETAPDLGEQPVQLGLAGTLSESTTPPVHTSSALVNPSTDLGRR